MTPALHADKMKLEQHCIYHYASALWDLHRGHRITWRVNSVKTSTQPDKSCQQTVSMPDLTADSYRDFMKAVLVLTAVTLLMDVEPLSLDSTCRLWFLLNDGSVQFHKQPQVNRAAYHQDPLYCRYPWQPGKFFFCPPQNPFMISSTFLAC